MAFLIDTCVFAEYDKPVPEERVLDWLATLPQEDAYISVITVGEIQKGITRLPSSRKKTSLTRFLDQLIVRFDDHVLPLTGKISRRWGSMAAELELKGLPMPIIDSLIAATALEHDLTLVTRNTRDFQPAGVKTLNVWE